VVDQACNPSTLEVETGGYRVQGQSGLHSQTVSQKTKQTRHQWLVPVILATWGAEMRRIEIQGQPGQFERPHFQNNQNKMDWRHGSRGRVPAFAS
jgi:hypothetical protein